MNTADIKRIESFSWPLNRLNQALTILALKAGFTEKENIEAPVPENSDSCDNKDMNQWADRASYQLGIEILDVKTSCGEVSQMLCKAGPCLIRIDTGECPRFIALLKNTWNKAVIIKPDSSITRVSLDIIQKAVVYPFEKSLSDSANNLLKKAQIPQRRLKATREAIIKEQLRDKDVGGIWLLRMRPGSSFRRQLINTRVPFMFAAILITHLMAQVLLIVSWWIIGSQAIEGHFENAPVMAWALILISIIPLNLLNIWTQNHFSNNMGGLFKQRLLNGILKLEPEEIRHKGTGQFMGLVMEADLITGFAVEGGLTAIIAIIELFIAALILSLGAGGIFHAVMLMGWILLGVYMCYRYYLKTRIWIGTYQEMTNDLVENMVGYRTRIAQEDPQFYHENEIKKLRNYIRDSEKLDNIGLFIKSVSGRGWLVAGLWGIFPALFNTPGTKADLAISIGGLLMSSQSLTQMTLGILNFIRVFTAWEQVKPLFSTASRMDKKHMGSDNFPVIIDKPENAKQQPLISFNNLSFKHKQTRTLILDSCSQEIYRGNRILLKGGSGQGKTTLANILAGQRLIENGEIYIQGTECDKINSALLQTCVSMTPQSNENHILTETFSFNLLMGNAWPPLRKDITRAEEICCELGLSNLLEKMPGRLYQMLGETGWRLSHGERTRVFIARALLRKTDMVILDENFAVLDPDNFIRVLECILKRSSTLLIIAQK